MKIKFHCFTSDDQLLLMIIQCFVSLQPQFYQNKSRSLFLSDSRLTGFGTGINRLKPFGPEIFPGKRKTFLVLVYFDEAITSSTVFIPIFWEQCPLAYLKIEFRHQSTNRELLTRSRNRNGTFHLGGHGHIYSNWHALPLPRQQTARVLMFISYQKCCISTTGGDKEC